MFGSWLGFGTGPKLDLGRKVVAVGFRMNLSRSTFGRPLPSL